MGMNEKPLRGLDRAICQCADAERLAGDLRGFSVGVPELDLPPLVLLGVEKP